MAVPRFGFSLNVEKLTSYCSRWFLTTDNCKKWRKTCAFDIIWHAGNEKQRGILTFPSSLGLSLKCTTGPGWVLVDLWEKQKTKEGWKSDAAATIKRMFNVYHTCCMIIECAPIPWPIWLWCDRITLQCLHCGLSHTQGGIWLTCSHVPI